MEHPGREDEDASAAPCALGTAIAGYYSRIAGSQRWWTLAVSVRAHGLEADFGEHVERGLASTRLCFRGNVHSRIPNPSIPTTAHVWGALLLASRKPSGLPGSTVSIHSATLVSATAMGLRSTPWIHARAQDLAEDARAFHWPLESECQVCATDFETSNTNPETPPLRAERHIPNSIATMRRRLIAAIVFRLPRCPCCAAPMARHRRKAL